MLLYCSVILSCAHLFRPETAYECTLYENDPSGSYLRVKDVERDLPAKYKPTVDVSYYKRMALAQPCLQTDPNVKIPILGSSDVEPRVIAGASSILSMLNASAAHMRKVADENVYVVIVPRGKSPCDLPEARGVDCDPNWGGANLKRSGAVVVIVRTESILCEQLNGFSQHGGTLIHEFTHAVEWTNKLQSRTYDAYVKAYWKGLWRGTYIDKGPVEYLAVGAEVYFGLPLNIAYQWPVRSREELKAYDWNLYLLLNEIFGDRSIIEGEHICMYKCD